MKSSWGVKGMKSSWGGHQGCVYLRSCLETLALRDRKVDRSPCRELRRSGVPRAASNPLDLSLLHSEVCCALHVVEDQPGSIAGTQGRAAQKASQGEKNTKTVDEGS